MWDEVTGNRSAAQDWTQVSVALRWIQLSTSSLSVVGSSSIIICVMSQRLRTTPELFPLLWLSLSDLLLSLFWLLAAAIFNSCSWLRLIEQVLYLSCFMFSLNLVWTQFISIKAHFTCHFTGCMGQISNRLSSRVKMAALLCGSVFLKLWCASSFRVLPVLLVTPVFVLSERSHCLSNATEIDRCLLMQTGALFMTSQHSQPIRACRLVQAYCSSTLLCTFLLTLAGIMGLMVRSRALLWRVLSCGGIVGCQQRALLQEMDLRMVLYPLVFFFCWGPAALVALLRLLFSSGPQGLIGAALYITQVLACGSQGLWFSLVFGGSRSRVLRDAQTQTPLMRSQKHRGYLSLGPSGYS